MNRRQRQTVISIAVAAICFASLAALSASGAPGARHPVSELHTVITLGTRGAPGTSSSRFLVVGTIDGWIGQMQVHGAERSLIQDLGSRKEIVRGTEFDRNGSRSFVIRITRIVANGRTRESGTGKWTGGTGLYEHARGTFRIRARGPGVGVHSVHFAGWIIY
jgi:hypothetical protein